MIDAFKNKKIGVLNGGFSSEREVSFWSGKNVYEALVRLGYTAVRLDPATEDITTSGIDVAFNVLHGQYGEDGSIQSLLELLNIPYTGSGPAASILSMNKLFSKQVFTQKQIPTAPYAVLNPEQPLPALAFPFPVIVKPVKEGSSFGVEIYDNQADYMAKAPALIKTFGTCLAEAFIPGKELTVGIIDTPKGPQALPILELRPHNRFYDFDAKYTPGKTDFILPAEISDSDSDLCQALATTLYTLFKCRGAARIDMILHPQTGPFVLEINSLPGLTNTSDLPAQAKQAGISFDALIELILSSAVDRKFAG